MPLLVKSQKSFEKIQENLGKRSGKISQLDLWQPSTCQKYSIFEK